MLLQGNSGFGRNMRSTLFVWLLLLLSSCMASISTNYTGTDVGYAVMGIGAKSSTNYDSYKLLFRLAGEERIGLFRYLPDYPLSLKNLFRNIKGYKTSDEAGIVEIAALPAGQYELVNFIVTNYIPLMVYGSPQDFSIPFEIKPGQVVYLGNYQANRIRKTNYHGPATSGAFFNVEDRFAKDMAIAKTLLTSLPIENARDATPDVKQVNNPFLISQNIGSNSLTLFTPQLLPVFQNDSAP
jgi:hypothetical protein